MLKATLVFAKVVLALIGYFGNFYELTKYCSVSLVVKGHVIESKHPQLYKILIKNIPLNWDFY